MYSFDAVWVDLEDEYGKPVIEKHEKQKLQNVYYDDFRNEMYDLSQQELYTKAYKIFIITEIFMMLTSEYKFTQKMLKNIVLFKGNILEQLYDEWLDTDYSHQEELEYIVRDSLKGLHKAVSLCA